MEKFDAMRADGSVMSPSVALSPTAAIDELNHAIRAEPARSSGIGGKGDTHHMVDVPSVTID